VEYLGVGRSRTTNCGTPARDRARPSADRAPATKDPRGTEGYSSGPTAQDEATSRGAVGINPSPLTRSWRQSVRVFKPGGVCGARALCVCAERVVCARGRCACVQCVCARCVCVRRARMAVHEPVRGARVIAGERVCAREP